MTREEFAGGYNEIIERASALSDRAHCYGLLDLESLIDKNKLLKRDVMETGLKLAVDAIDPEIINAILSNIVNTESDPEKKILKNIQKEAVLSIQAGDNPRILMLKLNSFVDIGIEEAMKVFSGN